MLGSKGLGKERAAPTAPKPVRAGTRLVQPRQDDVWVSIAWSGASTRATGAAQKAAHDPVRGRGSGSGRLGGGGAGQAAQADGAQGPLEPAAGPDGPSRGEARRGSH